VVKFWRGGASPGLTSGTLLNVILFVIHISLQPQYEILTLDGLVSKARSGLSKSPQP